MDILDRKSMDSVFNPKSIAIIGASADFKRIGGRPLKYLIEGDYSGDIYPVNPKYEEIEGIKCYGEILDIDKEVDLAIIALPSHLVLNAVKNCSRKGVKSVVIFSSGFAELGDEGKKIQDEISDVAINSNMRILGPNCLGMFNLNHNIYATFSVIIEEKKPIKGNIGFVSQSGAFGSHVFSLATQKEIGFSYFVATGNESDVDVADCITYLAEDPDTKIIACYLEGTKNGEKLLKAFETAKENKKPIVMMKVGKTDAGMKAALSHTASLAGEDIVYDTVFKQYGVYRANTIEEFLDVAYAGSVARYPKGDRVGIVTVSGGIGIMMADHLSELSFSLPEPPKNVQDKLRTIIPFAGLQNPIDTTAQIGNNPELLEEFLEEILNANIYDSVAIFLAFSGIMSSTIDQQLEIISKVSRKYPNNPVITITLNNKQTRLAFKEENLLLFEDPTRAINGLSALIEYNNYFDKLSNRDRPSINNEVSIQLPDNRKVYTEYRSKQIFEQMGLPITREKLAVSNQEAMQYAEEIGFPVVLKGMSPQILHKTDKDLVKLNIKNTDQTSKQYDYIVKQINSTNDANFEGVLVQEMVDDDFVEMFIGSQNDPTFGQMVVIGIGGVNIEVLQDTSMRKAPVTSIEAKEMIKDLKGYRLLAGYRGQSSYDIDKLSEVLSIFSRFITKYQKTIKEIDLNPIMVLKENHGVKIADGLIYLEET